MRQKQQTATELIYILPQLWLWQSNLFCHVNKIKICYVYLSLNRSVGEALEGGFKNYIISGRAQCSVAVEHWTDYKKHCVTTSRPGVSGLHVVHLTGLKVNPLLCMEKQSSHFRMKCLWRVCMPFYGGNWMSVWLALMSTLHFLLR